MTHGSLFSGIGGFDLGLERAGIETRWQIENDKFCNRVLQARFPEVKRYGDIKQLRPEELEPVEVISAGFPCQDLSVAGRRAGLAGERSGLFWELIRVLERALPRWCVLENVPGLLSSNGGCDFAAVLSALAQCGYFVEWAVLDSQHFGVAQRRRRVFLVGHLGEPPSRPVLLVAEGVRGDTAAGGKPGTETPGTAAFSAGNSGDAYGIGYTEEGTPPLKASESGTNQVPTIARCLNAHTGGASAKEQQETFIIKGAAIGRKPEAGPQRGEVLDDGSCYTLNTAEQHAVAQPVIGHHAKGGDPTMDNYVCYEENQRCEVRETKPCIKQPNGKNAPLVAGFTASASNTARGDNYAEGSSPPVRPLSKPSIATELTVRRLTPLECERLQGFPDGWTLLGDDPPDSPRYRALGNAVTVNVAHWIANRIIVADAERSRSEATK